MIRYVKDILIIVFGLALYPLSWYAIVIIGSSTYIELTDFQQQLDIASCPNLNNWFCITWMLISVPFALIIPSIYFWFAPKLFEKTKQKCQPTD